MPIKDLRGKAFGRLTVTERLVSTVHRHMLWRCRCECGSLTDVRGMDLRAGRVRSCGCIPRETGRANLRLAHADESIIGQRLFDATTRPPEYLAWTTMRKRSRNSGIPICDRWNDFAVFRADLGPRPSSHHRLIRKDVTRGYVPENVAWASLRGKA